MTTPPFSVAATDRRYRNAKAAILLILLIVVLVAVANPVYILPCCGLFIPLAGAYWFLHQEHKAERAAVIKWERRNHERL